MIAEAEAGLVARTRDVFALQRESRKLSRAVEFETLSRMRDIQNGDWEYVVFFL